MAEKINPKELDITDELIAERRSAIDAVMPSDMPIWMVNTIKSIDRFSLWVGKLVSWLLVPLCLAMVYEVIARKFFIAPTMWAYDISRFMYGAMFTIGAAYALSVGVHIRADFLYRNWSPKTQGIVDSALYILFYFPGLIVFLWMSVDYAWDAFLRGERGMDTAWMPYVGPIKSALPIGIIFLLIQGVSELLKSLYAARKGKWPF